MPGAGTDHTRIWAAGGPAIILVEPQLGENIGAAARAMANFGLSELRLVKPRNGWPSREAQIMASGADRILEEAALFDDVKTAIADCNFVFAATARAHDQAKPVVGADEAARTMAPRLAGGEKVAVMFGRERNGLENDEVGLADRIITLPVNPAFASLNLAQAVVIVAYEWFKLATGGALPFSMPQKSPQASKQQLHAFFADFESELEKIEYFRPAEKHGTMAINLRNIFNRMQPTKQDIRTLHGAIMGIAQGRKGPAKGGVLGGGEAEALRNLIAEQGQASSEQGVMRGLARLLRRNPTDAERSLWTAMTNDRRFARAGFKRQTPVGAFVADFVSFPLRIVIDLAPQEESAKAMQTRADRRAWLAAHDYRVIEVSAGDVEKDVGDAVNRIAAAAGLTDVSP